MRVQRVVIQAVLTLMTHAHTTEGTWSGVRDGSVLDGRRADQESHVKRHRTKYRDTTNEEKESEYIRRGGE
jgi:hypothetical protein